MQQKELLVFTDNNPSVDELNELLSPLRNPGQYCIYQNVENDICISYYRDLTRDNEVGFKTYLHNGKPYDFGKPCNSFTGSKEGDQIGHRKIKYADYLTHFSGDFSKLQAFVQKALKQLVVWDFDLTLTQIHTYFHLVESMKLSHPMRNANQTQQVIAALSALPNVLQIIVSNNMKKSIKDIIGTEYWSKDYPFSDYFKAVYGRDDFHMRKLGDDKALCMATFYDTWVTSASDSYLDFTKPFDEMVIDIVKITLVDDDNELNPGAHFYSFLKSLGLEIIKVNSDNMEDISHLEKLNKQFHLNLNLKEGTTLIETNQASSSMETTKEEPSEEDEFQAAPRQVPSVESSTESNNETSPLLRNSMSMWNKQRNGGERCKPCLPCRIL